MLSYERADVFGGRNVVAAKWWWEHYDYDDADHNGYQDGQVSPPSGLIVFYRDMKNNSCINASERLQNSTFIGITLKVDLSLAVFHRSLHWLAEVWNNNIEKSCTITRCNIAHNIYTGVATSIRIIIIYSIEWFHEWSWLRRIISRHTARGKRSSDGFVERSVNVWELNAFVADHSARSSRRSHAMLI